MSLYDEVTAHPRGAQFFRADLHIHSYGGSHDVKDSTMTPEAIVATAIAEGLGAIAVTDHNEINNVAPALAAAKNKLFVVPGVELSTPEGHLLCYLPSLPALEQFHGRLSIVDRDTPTSRCQTGVLECLRLLHEIGGFGVLAHVDGDGGYEKHVPGYGPHKVDVLCHAGLLGLELKHESSPILYTNEDSDPQRAAIAAERIARLKLGSRQFLARVSNSDSHALTALGKNASGDRRVTRIKMDTPTFAALKVAFEDSDARVRLEAQLPPSIAHVVGVHIEGGFLDGQMIHFSPNLNCIVGGRGTGKSTTFEAVRCLCGEQSDSDLVDSEIWPTKMHLIWQDEAGVRHLLCRELNGIVENTNDPVSGPSAFRIDCFGQGETAKISAQAHSNPMALLGYLDRFVDVRQARDDEEQARSDLLSLQTEIEKAEANVELIPQHERALAIVQQQLQALKTAGAEDLIELQRKLAEEATLREAVAQKLSAVKDIIAGGSPKATLAELRTLADPQHLTVGPTEFRLILEQVGAFEQHSATVDQTLQAALSGLIASTRSELTKWKGKESAIQASIDAKRKELEAQGHRLDMAYIQKLAKDEATHRQSVADLKTWKPHLNQLRIRRAAALKARWSARSAIYTAREGFARRANRVLHESLSDLTVTLKFVENGCSPEAERLIVDTMGWRTLQVPGARVLIQNLTVPKLLDAVSARDTKAITSLTVDGAQVFDLRAATVLLERLAQPHVRYQLERCELHELPRLLSLAEYSDGI
ncbi:PHP domain-containing protein [bacterium]|nr:PHP domain-containing protein [bacterium]